MKVIRVIIVTTLLVSCTESFVFAMNDQIIKTSVGIVAGGAIGAVVTPVVSTAGMFGAWNLIAEPEKPSDERLLIASTVALLTTAIPGAIAGAYLGAQYASEEVVSKAIPGVIGGIVVGALVLEPIREFMAKRALRPSR